MAQELSGQPAAVSSLASPRKWTLTILLGTGAGLYLLLVAAVLWALTHHPPAAPAPRIGSVHRLPSRRPGMLRLAISGTGLTTETRVSLSLDSSDRKAIIASLSTYGQPRDLAMVGDYALIANSYRGILSVDVADPRQPRIVGTLNLPGMSWHLSRSGNMLLVAALKGGVHLVDISNPRLPLLVGTIATTQPAIGAVAGKGIAYVLTTDRRLMLYDLRNPASPELLGQLPLREFPRNGTLLGSHLLLDCASAGLATVDVRDPRHPRLTARLALPGIAESTTVAGKFGYVAARNGGLQVIDLADPARPRLISSLSTPGAAYQVSIDGNLAYLADGESGLLVIDISNPRRPRLLHAVDSPGCDVAVAVHGKVALLTDEVNGLELIDLTALSPLPKIPFTFSAKLKKILFHGPLALVAAEESGLLVLDMGQVDAPRLIGQVDTPGDSHDLVTRGRLVYLADGPGGVQIADLGDPHNPQLVGHIDTAGRITAVAILNDLLLVADNPHRQLLLFNLGNPRQPRPGAVLSLPGQPKGIFAADGKAYIACGKEGLVVVALTDPEHPRIIGQWRPAWPQRDLLNGNLDKVLVKGQIAYLARSGQGLEVLDVSTPENPRLLAHRGGMRVAADLAAGNNQLYVADLPEGKIETFDISNPKQPLAVATLQTAGKARGIAFAKDRIYGLSGLVGLAVLPKPEISKSTEWFSDRSLVVELPEPPIAGNYRVRVFNEWGFDELPGDITIGAKEPVAAALPSQGRRPLPQRERAAP